MGGLILAGLLARGGGVLGALTASADPTPWYLTRMLAVSAYLSLSLSVIFGLLRTIARRARESLGWMVDELHQVLATLTGVLVVGHLVTLAKDAFIPFSISNLLLPGDQPYRPFAVDLGVLSLYTMIALLLSSWFKRQLPYGFWRVLHYISFATFVLVTLHGWQAGSDVDEPWMRALYGAATIAVAFLLLMRMFTITPKPSKQATF
jgi:predicted ferric reductase